MAVRMIRASCHLCGLGMLLLAHAPLRAAPAEGRVLADVVFSHYGGASSNRELVRRLLSPATAARLERQLADGGKTLEGQPVDLAAERFIVYVPPEVPARGYALLVFVPPWQQAGLPAGWKPVLDKHGAIFVSAARSGNNENTMARREPLALLAAQNVIADYRVDPERVYISGFSGGSRIAQRLAIGFPDLFRGVILNAGSNSLGDASAEPPIPLPPRALFYQFQSGTRLTYITGERDVDRVEEDRLSARSMRQWCVFNAENIVEPLLDHVVAQPAALDRALGNLDAGIRPDAERLARCRSNIDAEIDQKFRNVDALLAAGQRAAAERLLDKIDQNYGGLAAPRSVQLMQN
jgi:pimeloyl-ACP methyl ester carboxylesterase